MALNETKIYGNIEDDILNLKGYKIEKEDQHKR